MKFSRKSKKTNLFKQSSHQSRKKLSDRDLSIKINEVKNSKKKFRLSFIKKLTWHKKKDTSAVKLPIITSLSTPRIEKLENKFMSLLQVDLFSLNNSLKETIEKCNQYPTKFHSSKRLLITRSMDDFARTSRKLYLCSSLSSQPLHQSLLKNMARRSSDSDTSLTVIPRCQIKETIDSSIKSPLKLTKAKKSLLTKVSIKSESCLKKQKSPTDRQLSLHWDENSLKSISKQSQPHDAAIVEIEHQSYLLFNKSLEKSHSFPLPINTNHSSITNNHIQSAHIIDQYPYENKNRIFLYSCASEIGNDQSTESISSDEDSVNRRLLLYQKNINKKNLRHRWSLLDIWESTMAKLPPILNCIWRKRLRRTGTRECLLEYDQTVPTNNNNNRENFVQGQRYLEQERPTNSHIGLALFAFLIFPPAGAVALMLSIWSLCGQQDRHLSRKFGNAVYWISILSICSSFLLLLTLFTYFTYQYLINRPIIINQYLTTHRMRHSIIKDIEFI